MPRTPEDCLFREPLESDGETGTAACHLVRQITAIDDVEFYAVQRDACEACCRSLPTGQTINPVIASLIYNSAGKVIQAGGRRGCSVTQAKQLQGRVAAHLGLVLSGVPDACYPPDSAGTSERHLPPSSERRRTKPLTWMVGLITAPRPRPTIDRTLRSLRATGFAPVHIFAEPGSWIPREFSEFPAIVHPRRLGNFANFYTSLAALYRKRPEADGYVVFQDDVELAAGLKDWCDHHFWPLDAGLVSLFTSWVHHDVKVGWRRLSPGFHRVFGGQALVFRRDVLQRFLADPQVIHQLENRKHFDDCVVAAWAGRQGSGIAYHTPSLVRHIGTISSIWANGPEDRLFAAAVDSVERLADWRPPVRRAGRVGLVGWNAATGVGYQNRDLVQHFDIDRWLVPPNPWAGRLPTPRISDCRIEYASHSFGRQQLASWLKGLDWVLFIERPYLSGLAEAARRLQVGVACVPNWEWTSPSSEWLKYVDLMICPTRHTLLHMLDWKRRYGFGWEVMHVPWPVDVRRFRFRLRRRCGRFLFVNGWGGMCAQRFNGSRTEYSRKGIELIIEAAWKAPHLPFLVYSQRSDIPQLPDNVERRDSPASNTDLYHDGDVCIQPSHWEGLGLQLLECQAAGMPLVTTDAAPMNEHQPLRTIPVAGNEVVSVYNGQPIMSQLMTADDLISTLDTLYDADIAQASQRARQYVERVHCWEHAVNKLSSALAVP